MPLSVAQPAFISTLVANDEAGSATVEDAAAKFCNAFITWMGLSAVGAVPAVPVALETTRAIFVQNTITSFRALDPATHCSLFQIAVVSLLAPFTTIWPSVIAAAPIVPLATILPPMLTAQQPDNATAKTVLANGYFLWFSTGWACTIGTVTGIPIL
jgi:hypothetical protein